LFEGAKSGLDWKGHNYLLRCFIKQEYPVDQGKNVILDPTQPIFAFVPHSN
jgi:hypothetical protein